MVRTVAVVYCEGVNVNREAILDSGSVDVYQDFCDVSELQIQIGHKRLGLLSNNSNNDNDNNVESSGINNNNWITR